MRQMGENEMGKLWNGVENLKLWILEFLSAVKNTDDITVDTLSLWFLDLMKQLNTFHAISNNFIISVSRFLPIKTYNDGMMEAHDHILIQLNKTIDIIIRAFGEKYDDYCNDMLNFHKNNMDDTIVIVKTTISVWSIRMQQITRDLLTKLTSLEVTLMNTKHEMIDLFIRNGARRPSQHEESMYH